MTQGYDVLVRGILRLDPDYPEDEEKIKSGSRELVRYAWKKGEYCDNSELFEKITMLRSHPFVKSDKNDPVYLIGEIGVTYSIAPFLYWLSHEMEYLEELRLWFFRADGPGKYLPGVTDPHDIVAEIVTVGASYLCSGLTDYSGTGGSGFRKVREVFKSVSWMTGTIYTELEYHDYPDITLVLNDFVQAGVEVSFAEGVLW